MKREQTYRIILENPPAGVDYALQKGSGTHYDFVQKQRSSGADLVFEFTATVKPGPDFAGPFVQGKARERFVYLNIGTSAGQHDSLWSRRLKIPLNAAGEGEMLETRVPGTAKDGSPTCATVKPFMGWRPLTPEK